MRPHYGRPLGAARADSCAVLPCGARRSRPRLASLDGVVDMTAHAPGTISLMAEAECRDVLREAEIGRLAWVEPSGEINVVPVNVVVHDGLVVLRTSDAVAERLLAAPQVAFEFDDLHADTRSGCSVLVRGTLSELAADTVSPTPWAGDSRERVLGLPVERVTGRRVTAHKGAVVVVHL